MPVDAQSKKVCDLLACVIKVNFFDRACASRDSIQSLVCTHGDIWCTHSWFLMQSETDGVVVSVLSPVPIDMTNWRGLKVRITGSLVAAYSTPTVLLPAGQAGQPGVLLCEESEQSRGLKNEWFLGGASDNECGWIRDNLDACENHHSDRG